MVKEKPGWYVIDTSNTKPEEVANQILDLIEKVDTSK
jgi:regulator of PEP synthase PpsR (kinase-PPPase family)